MSDDSKDDTKEEILLAISISFGSLFIATVLTLIIAKYYKKIRACCSRCLPCLNTSEDGYENEAVFQQAFETDKVPLMLRASEKQPFIIPGTVYKETVQPGLPVSPDVIELSEEELRRWFSDEIKQSQDNNNEPSPMKQLGRSLSSSSSEHYRKPFPLLRFASIQNVGSFETELNPLTKRRNAMYASDPILEGDGEQFMNMGPTFQHENLHERRSNTLSSSHGPIRTIMESPEGSILYTDDEFTTEHHRSTLDVRPELYDKSRKKSVGIGTLGKIKVSLQFLDQERNKLELFLGSIDGFTANRHGMTSVYVGIMLLPDRDNMYKSRKHQLTNRPSFEQAFVFTRTETSETFETKTLRLLFILTGNSGRQETYGESRLQLANTEIYSKVPTNFVLNLRPQSQLTEIGDVLIEMVYTDDEEFVVIIKTLKLASKTSVENFLALQVKCVVKKKKIKLSPSAFAVTPVPERLQTYVPVNIELKQRIKKSSFAECALHLNVSAKHKIMGKKLTIGRAIIGNGALDQSEILNWRTLIRTNHPALQRKEMLQKCRVKMARSAEHASRSKMT